MLIGYGYSIPGNLQIWLAENAKSLPVLSKEQ
jgi:hypothetical protein